MKILLIYPEFPDTFWSFKHALKFIHKKSSFEPLGLITVAAMLPAKWEKRLVDMNVQSLTNEDIEWADYAFISAMVVQSESAKAVITRCKNAGLKIVAGGPLFTMDYAQYDDVDHLVLNEAEITLSEFLKDLEIGTPKHMYTSTEYADIKETPAPLWGLVDLKRYASISIQYSRGCPFDCEFCNVTSLLGHKPRIKSTRQVINELDSLYKAGWRNSVFFVDDNFIGNKKVIKEELLPALIEWQKDKVGMPFSTEASINIADDTELMEMMFAAGFDTVFIGIETPETEGLAECNKKQNLHRDLVADVKRIQRAGLQVQAGFIVGFDSDTQSTFQRQIEFIQKSGIVMAMVGLLQAPVGTKLHKRMEKEGRLVGTFSGNNSGATTNIIPHMNIDTLLAGYHEVVKHIYSPGNYYARAKTFLKEYKAPRFTSPLSFNHLWAFLRSAIQLGLFGRESVHYWRLLTWTLFHRPKLLSQAVTLSIYGYHFRKVYNINIA
jgi:radical SAM superfamily enzyme YgiQ (UPF0313 family)